MNAEIITVGTELLLGQIVDTNFAYIAERLAEAGINLYFKTSVGDNEKRVSDALKLALSRSDAVIITGGLGPTVDDVTRAALVKTLNLKLVLNEHVLKNIQSFFDSRKIKMSQNNVSQALVPNGATVIENKNGTAPGLIIPYGEYAAENQGGYSLDECGMNNKLNSARRNFGRKSAEFHNNKYVVIMPGVPREMKPMMTETVIPFLKVHFKTEGIIKSRVLKTFGLGESRVDEMIGDLFRSCTNPTIALLASHSEVKVRLTARAKDDTEAEILISDLETKIRERLDDNIFGVNDETMEKNVGMLMTMQNLTLATAESCTGGLIASRITDVAGASKYFMRGVVSYSNQSKIDTLDVKKITLDMYGAVSKQIAEEMAEGVRKVAETDIGLGITGIAGPTGGTEQKPVGLVFIALSTDKETISRECRFSGERVLIKERATQTALDMLRRYLLKI